MGLSGYKNNKKYCKFIFYNANEIDDKLQKYSTVIINLQENIDKRNERHRYFVRSKEIVKVVSHIMKSEDSVDPNPTDLVDDPIVVEVE